MAYSITKPNIYFSGDKRILTETVTGGVSKFNVVMTHAKDSMYYVINDSTKDTIEIAIEPFKTDTNCVLTNYIMFPNDFSGKAISFIAPDGYEIYYTGDYTRAKYTENTIIAIQHVDMGKIVVTINAGEKTEKYGVLLTLETTQPNETVYYTDPASNIDLSKVKMYWDYDPVSDKLGAATHDNSKSYVNPGTHYLIVISNDNLKFPSHETKTTDITDISNHLTEISKYKDHNPLLFSYSDPGKLAGYFTYYKKLKKINTGSIFDEFITDFSYCFYSCTALTSIPNDLFANNSGATNFSNCFRWDTALTEIPNGLFDNNINASDFSHCFDTCDRLTSIPIGLFNNNINVIDFTSCFETCLHITSNVPELWNSSKWTAVQRHEKCFSWCMNAANYASIPDGWK